MSLVSKRCKEETFIRVPVNSELLFSPYRSMGMQKPLRKSTTSSMQIHVQ